mmetsp:Transcript_32668/g.81319  ORF Transcript_32668/g.81319 Transcript_32668/m.81319 type:complete len:242 (+) Transcript_32668:440-1165(+)
MSQPVGSCQVNSPRARALKAMCALRAESLPLDIRGTRDAAIAQQTTMPAPAYKCGPGKSFCARMKVLTGPSIAKAVPRPRMTEPTWKCLSRNDPSASSLRVEESSSIWACKAETWRLSAASTGCSSPAASIFALSGFCCSFSSEISVPISRSRRHCSPLNAAYADAEYMSAITTGCASETMRPSKMPNSPSLARAASGYNAETSARHTASCTAVPPSSPRAATRGGSLSRSSGSNGEGARI